MRHGNHHNHGPDDKGAQMDHLIRARVPIEAAALNLLKKAWAQNTLQIVEDEIEKNEQPKEGEWKWRRVGSGREGESLHLCGTLLETIEWWSRNSCVNSWKFARSV